MCDFRNIHLPVWFHGASASSCGTCPLYGVVARDAHTRSSACWKDFRANSIKEKIFPAPRFSPGSLHLLNTSTRLERFQGRSCTRDSSPHHRTPAFSEPRRSASFRDYVCLAEIGRLQARISMMHIVPEISPRRSNYVASLVQLKRRFMRQKWISDRWIPVGRWARDPVRPNENVFLLPLRLAFRS